MADNNFHKLALSESFERVAKVAKEREAFNEQMALREENEQLRAALHDVDELCQQGLNSPEPVHWEATLQDIMELVRAATRLCLTQSNSIRRDA